METRNEKVLTIYATERKRLTKEQRHLYKFKKKYNYKDIGNDIGVINSNGKSYYVDMDLKNKEPMTINKSIHTPIQIGSNILKLKPKSETIQAVIVVPILAPKITPTDCARVKSPALIKDTTITGVAPDD